jgi:hypothetical protein
MNAVYAINFSHSVTRLLLCYIIISHFSLFAMLLILYFVHKSRTIQPIPNSSDRTEAHRLMKKLMHVREEYHREFQIKGMYTMLS